jgi:predicted transcriptional regulator YdeE
MRILKYLFLLVLLSFVGLTVFLATQKGDFEVTKSRIIKTQKTTTFDYVNDFRNWETFCSWLKDDGDIVYNYPAKTIGKGGSYSWQGNDNEGKINTYFVKENDSLAQNMELNGITTTLSWTFKDTVGGTKTTLHSKGKMSVIAKIKVFFQGGIVSTLGSQYELSLRNLDKTLDYEMKKYSIKVNGVIQRKSGFYLKQTVTCKLKSLSKNIRIMMPKMVYFFKKNKIPMNGKPFVLYDKYDLPNNIVTFSVCGPVQDSVSIMPGSDMSAGKLDAFTSLKTTLVGDYSHSKEAWNKAYKYIQDNGLKENFAGHHVEVYTRTIDQVKNPSMWITEIYIPVFPKAVVPALVATPIVPVVAPPKAEPATDGIGTP